MDIHATINNKKGNFGRQSSGTTLPTMAYIEEDGLALPDDIQQEEIRQEGTKQGGNKQDYTSMLRASASRPIEASSSLLLNDEVVNTTAGDHRRYRSERDTRLILESHSLFFLLK